ncbi:MAG: hypothetical protein L0Y57_00230 [Beijerinckiaceae bacterium]|nr:hypothetical protein [Beijerinckiaceae bacterium]
MKLGISLAIAIAAAVLLAPSRASAVPNGPVNEALSFGYQAPFRKAVFIGELYTEQYVIPYYNEQNYCWQQVWTPHGWRWVDVCYGYVF